MTLLVIDAGSSSIRALLLDGEARPVPGAIARQEHHFQRHQPGQSIADAQHLRQLIETCIDEILQHPSASELRAVGMATFVGNVVGLDADGRPVTPLYTYADTRSGDYTKSLLTPSAHSNNHQRTGCPLHTAYHPSRLNWLRAEYPDLFQRVARWSDLATLCYSAWFGYQVPTSISVASWSGLLNRETLTWDGNWRDQLNLEKDALPPLSDYAPPLRGLSAAYARRWPALADLPFFLAVGDGAAANVGSGAGEHGSVALTIGTTAAMRTVSTQALPPVPDGLWSYRIDQQRHLIGGATSEGGNVFEWAQKTLRLPDAAVLEETLRRTEPGAHGLTLLPLLAGERSPGWWSQATGAIAGLRLTTTPLHILQAALEGVALRLAIVSDQLDAEGEVMASGGGLGASPAWAQIITDALDRPLNLLATSEVTARGVAILMLTALDGRAITEFDAEITERLTPDPQRAARLRELRTQQQALYHALYDLLHQAR